MINFNPIIVLFLTLVTVVLLELVDEFQSYYSLISNKHMQIYCYMQYDFNPIIVLFLTNKIEPIFN